MKLFNFLLGRQEFKSVEEVIDVIKSFDRFDAKLELIEGAEALLVFKSETQQAWLVFTSQRFYYVLDDVDEGKTVALWARDRDKMTDGTRISMHLKERSVSKETGEILFGRQNHSFMYTKSLFKGCSIGGEILRLTNKHFLKVEPDPDGV